MVTGMPNAYPWHPNSMPEACQSYARHLHHYRHTVGILWHREALQAIDFCRITSTYPAYVLHLLCVI